MSRLVHTHDACNSHAALRALEDARICLRAQAIRAELRHTAASWHEARRLISRWRICCVVLARERCEGPMVAVRVSHGEVARGIVALVDDLVHDPRPQFNGASQHRVRIGGHHV